MMGMQRLGSPGQGQGLGGSMSGGFGGMRQGLMGSAMADPLNQGGGQLGGGGNSMDVMGSLRQHSDFATQFQRNPGASPGGGMMQGGAFGW
jgi:hypothetical protein